MLSRIVFFIETMAPGLYIFCAFGLLVAARQLMLSQHELRIAEFELERELARKKQAGAITNFFGLIEVGLAVAAIAFVVAPTVRDDLSTGGDPGLPVQPTSAPFFTSTPGGNGGVGADGSPVSGGSIDELMQTVTAAARSGDSGPILLLTPIASATFVGTINPDVPKPSGCETADAQLEVPANGQVIFDSVEVRGVANTSNFAMYKFEMNGPSTGNQFAIVGGDRVSPVPQLGVLGQVPLTGFQPGLYQFRLSVFDNTSNLRASCTVTVEVREHPPTPTPPGGQP
jgi:hypothetical protein